MIGWLSWFGLLTPNKLVVKVGKFLTLKDQN